MVLYLSGFIKNKLVEGFPGGSVVKNLTAKVGDMSSIPGSGGLHMLQGS